MKQLLIRIVLSLLSACPDNRRKTKTAGWTVVEAVITLGTIAILLIWIVVIAHFVRKFW